MNGGPPDGLFPAEDEAEERRRLLPDLRQLLLPTGEEEQEQVGEEARPPLEAQEGRGERPGMRGAAQEGRRRQGTEAGGRGGDRRRPGRGQLRILPPRGDGGLPGRKEGDRPPCLREPDRLPPLGRPLPARRGESRGPVLEAEDLRRGVPGEVRGSLAEGVHGTEVRGALPSRRVLPGCDRHPQPCGGQALRERQAPGLLRLHELLLRDRLRVRDQAQGAFEGEPHGPDRLHGPDARLGPHPVPEGGLPGEREREAASPPGQEEGTGGQGEQG